MIINKKRCLNGIITFLVSYSLSLLHNVKNKSTSVLVKRLNGTKFISFLYTTVSPDIKSSSLNIYK